MAGPSRPALLAIDEPAGAWPLALAAALATMAALAGCHGPEVGEGTADGGAGTAGTDGSARGGTLGTAGAKGGAGAGGGAGGSGGGGAAGSASAGASGSSAGAGGASGGNGGSSGGAGGAGGSRGGNGGSSGGAGGSSAGAGGSAAGPGGAGGSAGAGGSTGGTGGAGGTVATGHPYLYAILSDSLVAANSTVVELEVVDATTWTLVRDVPITAITSVTDLAVHPSGAKIFVNTSDNDTYALDATTGAAIIHAGTSGANWHRGLELSPDGTRFYSSFLYPQNPASESGVSADDTVTFAGTDSFVFWDSTFFGLDYFALSPDASEVALCLGTNTTGWAVRLIHTAPEMGIDATLQAYPGPQDQYVLSPVFTDDGKVLVYSPDANRSAQTGLGQLAIYPFDVASRTALAPLIMSSYTRVQTCAYGCLAYDSVHKRAVAVGSNNDVVMVNTDGTNGSFTAAPAGTAPGMVKAIPGGTAYLIAHASSGTTTPTADTLYDASSPALPELYRFSSTTRHVLAARFAMISP